MKAAAFGSIRALMWETEGGCSEGRMASMDAADFFLPSTISDPIVRERAVLRVRLRERRPEHPPHALHEPGVWVSPVQIYPQSFWTDISIFFALVSLRTRETRSTLRLSAATRARPSARGLSS